MISYIIPGTNSVIIKMDGVTDLAYHDGLYVEVIDLPVGYLYKHRVFEKVVT